MKILLFTNHFYPESFRCNDIAFELAKRGCQVKVLTGIPDYPKGKFHDGYSLFKKRVEIIQAVEVVRIPVIPRGNGRALRLIMQYASSIVMFFFYALYQALFHKYDCVYVHNTSPAFVCLPAKVVKTIQRIPLVVWILDMWPESLVAGGIKSEKVYNCIEKMMQGIYKKSDVIQISSLGFRELLVERNVPDEKIEYLPNWSDDAITNHTGMVIDDVPDGFVLMFAGNIGEAQNMENLLNAALLLKEHKDIHWVFLGDGRKKLWVDQFVADNGLQETVHLLGRKPIEAMPAYFFKASLMIVSLKDELAFNLTLPAKVQAYMSCSKPILGMLNGEGADIIQAADCGWCAGAADIQGMSDLVLSLYRLSSEKLAQKGSNGYEYYRKNFYKDICIDRIENTLASLVKK